MYRILEDGRILRIEDNFIVPQHNMSDDYQIYLSWLALGNAPIPYTPPPIPVNYAGLISNIEGQAMLNRGARELHMRLIEREADIQATSEISAETILANQHYYKKLKEMDDLIREYRTYL